MHSRSCTTNYSSYYFYNTCLWKELVLMILLYSAPPRTCLYHGRTVKIAPQTEEWMSAWNSINQEEGRLWPDATTFEDCHLSHILLFAFLQKESFLLDIPEVPACVHVEGWGCHLGFLQPITTTVRPASKLAKVSPKCVAQHEHYLPECLQGFQNK